MYSNKTNLIIGFHGCDLSIRNILLNKPNSIQKSKKPYDWLGHGVYFWENNLERSEQWAKEKAKRGEIENPSVIGAILSLDYCFDLMDTQFIEILQSYYHLMVKDYAELGKELPKNKDAETDQFKDKIFRELDCSVIEYMHKKIEEKINDDKSLKGFSNFKMFDSSRGVFTEGGPAFEGVGIQLKNHIQICIRNPNCIKGFFLPRTEINFDN
jgi:hypothetical protein